MQPEKLIPESQIKTAVKEILAEMLGVSLEQQTNRQWYDTDPAYSLLGLGSAKNLRKMVHSGFLRIGKEVRDIRLHSSSDRPRYQFHIEKCEVRLAELPERRPSDQRSRTKKAA